MRTEHQPSFARHRAAGWPAFRKVSFQGFRGGIAINQSGRSWWFRLVVLQIAQVGFLLMCRLFRLGELVDFLLDAAVLRLPSFHCRRAIFD